MTERQFGRNAERTGFPNSKLKFYLSFENAFHCNDYIRQSSFNNNLALKIGLENYKKYDRIFFRLIGNAIKNNK